MQPHKTYTLKINNLHQISELRVLDGVSVNNGNYQVSTQKDFCDWTEFHAEIDVVPEDVGKQGTLVAYALIH